jgi:hypothetical protein
MKKYFSPRIILFFNISAPFGGSCLKNLAGEKKQIAVRSRNKKKENILGGSNGFVSSANYDFLEVFSS